MAFNPNRLPADVREAFKMGALAWPLAVSRAVQANIVSLSYLTDMVFYMHHPERIGRPLDASETGLIEEWRSFQFLIRPTIPHHKKAAPDATADSPAGVAGDLTRSRHWALSLVKANPTLWVLDLLNVASKQAHEAILK